MSNQDVFAHLPQSEQTALLVGGQSDLSPDQQAYGLRVARLRSALAQQGYADAADNLPAYLQQKYGDGRAPDTELGQIERRIGNPQTAPHFADEAARSLVGARQAFAQGGEVGLQAYRASLNGKNPPGGNMANPNFWNENTYSGGVPGTDPSSLSNRLLAQRGPAGYDPMFGAYDSAYFRQANPLYGQQPPQAPNEGTLPGMPADAAQRLAAAMGQSQGGAPQSQVVPPQGAMLPSMQQQRGFGQPPAPSYYPPPPPPPQINPNSQFRQAPMAQTQSYQQNPMAQTPSYAQNPMAQASTAMARPVAPPQGPAPVARPPTTPPQGNPYQSGMYAPNTQVGVNPYQYRPPGATLPPGLGR